MSSLNAPASSKTTGRIGASRRQSASFWSSRRGARKESRVAVQLGSVAARRSSGGKVHTGRPSPSRPSPQRRRVQQLQRARQGVAERGRREPRPFPGAREQGAAAFDLRLQRAPPLAGLLQLFDGRPLLRFVQVRRLDLAPQGVGLPVADAVAPKPALHVVVDDPGQAPQLPLDGPGLGDEYFQHPVLRPLRQDEVVAADLRRGLELAVDAAVALLDAAGVPGQVEVEEVGAVGLEVEALARRVGGDEDAQGVARGVGVEAALDLPAAAWGCA